LRHQRDEFVFAFLRGVNAQRFERRAFQRQRVARARAERFEQRAQFIARERLFEKIALFRRDFFGGKPRLRVTARASGGTNKKLDRHSTRRHLPRPSPIPSTAKTKTRTTSTAINAKITARISWLPPEQFRETGGPPIRSD